MRTLSAGLAVLCAWGVALAQEDDPFAVLARTNPDIVAAEAEARAAAADLSAARGARLPQLRIEAQAGTVDETLRLGGLAGSLGGTRDPASVAAVAEQALFTSGRIAGTIDGAKGSAAAAAQNAVAVRQQVLLAGAAASATLVQARAALMERTQNAEALRRRLDETNARRAAGLATVTDVSQSEARLSQAEADGIAAAGEVSLAEARYARVFGEPAPVAATMPAPPEGLPDNLEAALLAAREVSPAVLRSRAEVRAARGEARAARGALLPQVSLSAQAAYAEQERFGPELGEAEQYGVFLQGRWDLFSGGSGYARASAAKRRGRAAAARAEADLRAVTERIVAAWTRIETATAVLEARRAAATAALSARDGVAAEQEAGRRTRLDLLDAERELTEARVGVTAAQRDLLIGRYELAAVLGRL